MPTAPERLRNIKTFAQLLEYLRDELNWPIETDDLEEVTFDWTDDLALAPEHRVKIKHIKQLRPLDSRQPWGIFFVEFEKKRLPVVVLRRILSQLVIKKRHAASKAERAAWHAHDLLFVSAFGEEASDQREIAFAHFHDDAGDLPTLRVLGWDGGDSPLKLEHLEGELKEKLHWPAKPDDHEAWRAQWTRAFRHRIGHVIRTADMLAEALAALARNIRDAAETIISHETDKGPLTKLFKAFQTALIHDLTKETFADTYAQTITYGLLTAAISRTEMSDGRHGTALIATNVMDMVPVTNPFLKEMLEEFLRAGGRKGGIDFDELGVQDVVELLRGDETDLPAILRDFGNKTRGEDPVIHFYEHFLSAYNRKLKVQRGVFYTPQPVVSYIVRSVHELLQTEFGLADGLADTTTWGEMLTRQPTWKLPPLTDESGETRTISADESFVQILDPATGTATFLVEVIDLIHKHLRARWENGGDLPDVPKTAVPIMKPRFEDYWNQYVPAHLLPRLHAFELMMAPYAIAHMKIGLKLAETGYRFGTEERARIYLTNALEPKVKQLPQIGFDALAHEAAAVNEIKWYKRFTVVIGNPPYSLYTANLTEAGNSLIEPFRSVAGGAVRERGALQLEKNLQDDYVKFFGLARSILKGSGVGALGLISNHGYLNNRTLRGMRYSLVEFFDRAWILELHGSASRSSTKSREASDQNVFDIQQGVAVSVFSRVDETTRSVSHEEILGARSLKYDWLAKHSITDTDWSPVSPSEPYYLLEPRNADTDAEYRNGVSIDQVFPLNSTGIVTARDALVVQFTRSDVEAVTARLGQLSAEQTRSEFELGDDTKDWAVWRAQKDIKEASRRKVAPTAIWYRPFDVRWTYYTGQARGFMCNPRRPVMDNLLDGTNLALCSNRQVNSEFRHVGVTRGLITDCTLSTATKERTYAFPLYLAIDSDSLLHRESRPLNLSTSFLTRLATSLGLQQAGEFGVPAGLTPEDIFHYAYAVLHSPGYRSRYAEFLKIDFPRLPLTGSLGLFRALAKLGGELVSLHLLESPRLNTPITEFIDGRNPEVEKVSYEDKTVFVDKAQTTGFKGVREEVWNFHIGGYQVCEKWLKDRKGRRLSAEDRSHYQKIVVALSETIRLMKEIDEVIEKHGGWPLK